MSLSPDNNSILDLDPFRASRFGVRDPRDLAGRLLPVLASEHNGHTSKARAAARAIERVNWAASVFGKTEAIRLPRRRVWLTSALSWFETARGQRLTPVLVAYDETLSASIAEAA